MEKSSGTQPESQMNSAESTILSQNERRYVYDGDCHAKLFCIITMFDLFRTKYSDSDSTIISEFKTNFLLIH